MDAALNQMKEALEAGNAEIALQRARYFIQNTKGAAPEQLAEPVYQNIIEVYRELHFPGVHQFFQAMQRELPEAFCRALSARLEPQVQETMKWARKLQSFSTERQTANLRDLLRAGEFEKAGRQFKNLLGGDKKDEQLDQMARFLGQSLATLINDQEKVETFLRPIAANPEKFGLTAGRLQLLRQARSERAVTIYAEGTETLERSFRAALNDLLSDLRGRLPGRMKTAEQMTEGDVEKFRVAVRALFGATLAAKDSARWYDLVQVIVELCPQTLSLTGAQAGIEERIYAAVTPVEQRVIDKCLYEIGQVQHAGERLLRFAKGLEKNETRTLVHVIEIMGMLRADRFIPFILEKLKSVKESQVVTVQALGLIGSPMAAEELAALLRKVIAGGLSKGRLPEGPHRRGAHAILSALGMIASSRRCNPGQRNRILEQARGLLPAADQRLLLETALDFFRAPAADWSAENLHWAIETLANGLWMLDNAPAFAAGGERETVLGFREPITAALARLAPKNPELFLQTVQQHLNQPGAAFIACGKIARESKLSDIAPLLEQMIIATMKMPAGTKYSQETFFDSASRERKDLTRDLIVSELIYALSEMQTPEAGQALDKLFEIFKSGRLENPGEDSMKVLFDARQRAGIKKRTDERAPEAEVSIHDRETQSEGLSDEEIQKLLKDLKPGLFFTAGKRPRIVAAIAKLGENFAVEAIEPLLNLCLSKDAVLSGAARQAIMRLGDVDAPREVSTALCMSLIERCEHKRIDVSESARELLAALRPDREPFKSQLARIIRSEGDSPLGRTLLDVIARSQYGGKSGAPPIRLVTAGAAAQPGGEGAGGDAAVKPGEVPQHLRFSHQLELKRQYLQARKAWIAGGKQGPPPEAPPGI